MTTKTRKKKATTSENGKLKPTRPITEVVAELQEFQRERAIVIKSRNMMTNRLQAIVAGTLGYRSGLDKSERMKKFIEAAKIIKDIENHKDHVYYKTIVATTVGINALNAQKEFLESDMLKTVKELPVLGWVKRPELRGFGSMFLAIVIGETGDLNLYSNPAKVWRRLGCAPWTFNGKTLMGATWRSKKEGRLPDEEWENFGYSPRRRSIAYLIGEGLMKQNTMKTAGGDDERCETENEQVTPGPYRARYDEAKRVAKEKHPDWPDIRCHRHGMLLAAKRLLLDLWVEWRKQPT